MLRGLTTVSFFADDLGAARDWYSAVLGIDPYYVQEVEGTPAYIEFRIGDHQHELGIIDSRFAHVDRSPGAPDSMTYWHVDDLDASLGELVRLGATLHAQPREHAPGYVTASVVDPFGNVLGIMYNQHYLDMLSLRPGA